MGVLSLQVSIFHLDCHKVHLYSQFVLFNNVALVSKASPYHHHPCRLSHLKSVVQWPGSCLDATASSLAAQSLPWDYCYCTK